VVTNQHSFIDQSIYQCQDCFNAFLKAKSKHWTFATMFLRNCHDFWSVGYCCYEQIDLCFVSQVGWEQPLGDVGNFVAVLLKIYFGICMPKLSKYNGVWRSYYKNKKGAIFASQYRRGMENQSMALSQKSHQSFRVIFIPLEWHLISQRPRSVAKNISRRYWQWLLSGISFH